MQFTRRNFLGTCLCAAAAFVAPRSEAKSTTYVVPFPEGISGEPIAIRVERYGKGPAFINVHENEDTSVEASRILLKKHGGSLVLLQQSGKRNLSFTMNGAEYAIDPNRIFTRGGINAALSKHTKEDRVYVTEFVQSIAVELVKAIYFGSGTVRGNDLKRLLVVALHNNSPGSLSIDSYGHDLPFRAGVAKLTKSETADADNFFFVTNDDVYGLLAKGGVWNVVLQNVATVPDDGSLAVFCARANIRYVNVEAQHGHLEAQTRMIEALYKRVLLRKIS